MEPINIKDCNGYALRVDFSVNNNGTAFACNDYGYVYVVICHWENEEYIEDLNIEVGRARRKAEADKIGRRYIRENDLRSKLTELSNEGQL